MNWSFYWKVEGKKILVRFYRNTFIYYLITGSGKNGVFYWKVEGKAILIRFYRNIFIYYLITGSGKKRAVE